MYMNCNFNEYIESHHLNQFIYTNYCMTENNKVDNVVDIKNFKEFWNTKVAPKYKLRQVYNIPHENITQPIDEKIYFTQELVDKINKDYYLDFIEGGYEILKDVDEVNKFCDL